MNRYRGSTPDIFLQEQVSNDAVIVRIEYEGESLNNDKIVVIASSKRDPSDKFDPEVGVNLAYARAFQSLAKKLQKRANGKVVHNDNISAKKRLNEAYDIVAGALETLDNSARISASTVNVNEQNNNLVVKKRKWQEVSKKTKKDK